MTCYECKRIAFRGYQFLYPGADIVLKPGDPYRVQSQILAAVEDGSLAIERIDESVLRIIRVKLKRGIGQPPPDNFEEVLGNEEHRRVVNEVASN